VMASVLDGKYKQIGIAGRGSYGQVWQVQRLADNGIYVAKIMAREKEHRHSAEIKCLQLCQHFGVIQLIESFYSDVGPVMILEYAPGGDLSKTIKSRAHNKEHFSEEQIGMMFVQMCMAVDYLHRHKMLHRDIKSANILLGECGLVKLSDFGFSRKFDGTVSNSVASTFLGTPYYLAPEMWKRAKYNKKADVWSLGIVLYEMMALKRPFVSQSMKGLMTAIVSGVYEPPPTQYSPELCALLSTMLAVDEAHRPSAGDILRSPVIERYVHQFEASIALDPALAVESRHLMRRNLTEMRESTPHTSNMSSPAPSPKNSNFGIPEPETVFEGPLQIGSAKEWKARYVVLRDLALVVTRNKDDARYQKLHFDTIAEVKPHVPKDGPDDNVFSLVLTTGFTVWLKASSPELRQKWIDLVNDGLEAARKGGPRRSAPSSQPSSAAASPSSAYQD
jgi:serine/threonine protein kinase